MSEPIHDGVVTTLRDDGSRLSETTYVQGVRHGPYRDYWSNGRLACEGQYVHGVREGEWRHYSKDSGEMDVVRFENDREVVDWDEFFRRAEPTTG